MSFKIKKPKKLQRNTYVERAERKKQERLRKLKEKQDGFNNIETIIIDESPEIIQDNIPKLDNPIEFQSVTKDGKKAITTCTKAKIDIGSGTLTIDENSCTTEILENQIKLDDSKDNDKDESDNDSELMEI